MERQGQRKTKSIVRKINKSYFSANIISHPPNAGRKAHSANGNKNNKSAMTTTFSINTRIHLHETMARKRRAQEAVKQFEGGL